jgi:hypothetical protein
VLPEPPLPGRGKVPSGDGSSLRKQPGLITSLFLEPVAYPIERFDHVERIFGLLEFLSQSLDVTVDCKPINVRSQKAGQ